MSRALIAAGSNLAPAENLLAAVRLLAQTAQIAGISTVYQTPAEDRPEQPDYYNCVIALETDLIPERLKRDILGPIEAKLGRVRNNDKFAPRTIDLDLILYDDLVLRNSELTLPDPVIYRRPYLAAGIAELSPGLILPDSGRAVEKVRDEMPDPEIIPLVDYTKTLRKAGGIGGK